MLRCFLLSSFIFALASCAYEPGTPGAAWTDEELDVVREKIEAMMDCRMEYILTGQDGKQCWVGQKDLGLDGDIEKYIDSDERLDEYAQNIQEADEDLKEILQDTRKGYKAVNKFKNLNNQRFKWLHRGPRSTRLIQLAFHDCLRYDDGSGGCDGCINWNDVGYAPPNTLKIEADNVDNESDEPVDTSEWDKFHSKMPRRTMTSNNKLQLTARSLELIYRKTDWPPGTPELAQSLFESGKSRADLWAFAGQVGLEHVMKVTNDNCDDPDPVMNLEYQLSAIEGVDKCKFGLRNGREVRFKSGRSDCIPEAGKKWTPYPFEATKHENHANAYGTGNAVIEALQKDFDLEPAESLSLMAIHGAAAFGGNIEEAAKYKWIGGSMRGPTGDGGDERQGEGSFSNMYFKTLAGKIYRPQMRSNNAFLIGDVNGEPLEESMAWQLQCSAGVKLPETLKGDDIRGLFHGGPCHFKLSAPGCSPNDDPDKLLRKECFKPTDDPALAYYTDHMGIMWRRKGGSCKNAELIEGKDGRGVIQVGGPPITDAELDENCNSTLSKPFAFPYEVGMVMDFDVDVEYDNIPNGCGNLDKPWHSNEYERKGHPLPYSTFLDVSSKENSCGKNNKYGTYDAVRRFAADNWEWQETFYTAFEKILTNGYESLQESGPAGNLKFN